MCACASVLPKVYQQLIYFKCVNAHEVYLHFIPLVSSQLPNGCYWHQNSEPCDVMGRRRVSRYSLSDAIVVLNLKFNAKKRLALHRTSRPVSHKHNIHTRQLPRIIDSNLNFSLSGCTQIKWKKLRKKEEKDPIRYGIDVSSVLPVAYSVCSRWPTSHRNWNWN